MIDTFIGVAAPLSQKAFDDAIDILQIDAASLWSLLAVETRGFGFLSDKRLKILFERHIFSKRTGGQFDLHAPSISAATAGGYEGGALEYARLEHAIRLDPRAALESASWGLPQIMGFNALSLRYGGAEDMVVQFLSGEDDQLDGCTRFITFNSSLASAIRKRNWATVAFYYNGSGYKKNEYDIRLSNFYDLYSSNHGPSIEVRAAQARLLYLGYDPHGVDGFLGRGSRAALLAFQKAAGLPTTAALDDATGQELRLRAGV